MAGLTTSGLVSGLDVNGLVSQLMAIEKKPLAQLDTREAAVQQRLSAFGALKGALSSLQTAAQSLSSPSRFTGFSSTVSDSSVATVSVGANPAVGSYSLEVSSLAQAHKVATAALPATGSLGTGTLTIDFGSYAGGAFAKDADTGSISVTVGPGEDGLAKVRDAINAANGAATASLVNDGTGTRLVIASKQTGTEHALRISVTDDDGNAADAAGLSRLAYDASTGGVQNMGQTIEAKDAVAIIDGITIRSDKNTITDALEGVTLTLTKADPGRTHTLSVNRDTAAAKGAVEQFVKAWNDTAKLMRDLSAYDAANKKASILTGDTALSGIQSRLRGVLNSMQPAGGFASLSEMGVTTNRDGTLALDAAKLAKVAADPAKSIAAFFATSALATGDGITVKSTGSLAETGSHAVNITRAATKGAAVGSAAAATTITAGVNDTLQVTVDGHLTTVTLAAGTYTPASLATELQTKLNGALGSLGSVEATESGGVLTLASGSWGSESTVAITGGTAAADLFGTATETAGVDVEGLIGGVVATGSGRTLSASGFVLEITGTATGERGAVGFQKGLGGRLDALVADLLNEKGVLRARTDNLDTTIKQIGERREALNLRLELTEKRLKAQFNALDLTLTRMQSTSNWLASQLASLPKAGNT
jgi:flagellar hook-associated protein 2